MYSNLKISNFKCFVNNSFKLKEMTIFTGVNAAGKSSVIQALLLFNGAMKCDDNELLDAREVLKIDIGSPKNMVSQNAQSMEEYDFCIQLDDEAVGFSIDKETGLNMQVKKRGTVKTVEFSYLNTERMGPRSSYVAGGAEKIKSDGSNAVYLMERADNTDLRVPAELMLDARTPKFSSQVECWMSAILGNVQLNKTIDPKKAIAELSIKNELVDMPVNPTLTGFGISYELSVVVAALWMAARNKGVLIVENPEAHLHPSAQSAIGKFLAIVAGTGVQVIVETHSEHVIDGARIQMYAMNKSDDLVINYLRNESGSMDIVEILVDEDGELTEWPDGFFDQKRLDLRELFKLRRDNGDK